MAFTHCTNHSPTAFQHDPLLSPTLPHQGRRPALEPGPHRHRRRQRRANGKAPHNPQPGHDHGHQAADEARRHAAQHQEVVQTQDVHECHRVDRVQTVHHTPPLHAHHKQRAHRNTRHGEKRRQLGHAQHQLAPHPRVQPLIYPLVHEVLHNCFQIDLKPTRPVGFTELLQRPYFRARPVGRNTLEDSGVEALLQFFHGPPWPQQLIEALKVVNVPDPLQRFLAQNLELLVEVPEHGRVVALERSRSRLVNHAVEALPRALHVLGLAAVQAVHLVPPPQAQVLNGHVKHRLRGRPEGHQLMQVRVEGTLELVQNLQRSGTTHVVPMVTAFVSEQRDLLLQKSQGRLVECVQRLEFADFAVVHVVRTALPRPQRFHKVLVRHPVFLNGVAVGTGNEELHRTPRSLLEQHVHFPFVFSVQLAYLRVDKLHDLCGDPAARGGVGILGFLVYRCTVPADQFVFVSFECVDHTGHHRQLELRHTIAYALLDCRHIRAAVLESNITQLLANHRPQLLQALFKLGPDSVVLIRTQVVLRVQRHDLKVLSSRPSVELFQVALERYWLLVHVFPQFRTV
ncbi:uncharacterized protein BcabD6B2_26770 [Babesia caballi]|uniref:Uncharacterized protein n=1 Tax=Babesia caballi TaxID=5871 RepID=A0AAV4LTY8_BABCB|nr:hypothetical protein BcabD6B2_26770 [Babesia caballi]